MHTQTKRHSPPSSGAGPAVEEAGLGVAVGARAEAAVGILVSPGAPATAIETWHTEQLSQTLHSTGFYKKKHLSP